MIGMWKTAELNSAAQVGHGVLRHPYSSKSLSEHETSVNASGPV
jgi:hypothetical protein